MANSVENAKAIYEACDGHVCVGVLSSNYDSIEEAVNDMLQYCDVINNNVSIGLGGGNPKQADMVWRIGAHVPATHINQVFTSVSATRATCINEHAHINALVSPSGTPGKVIISTGANASRAQKPAIVCIETAIAMIQDMGGNSIKFFPMKGLSTKDEYIAVCEACAKHKFALEPTGGLDLDNLEEVLRIALDAGVPKIIPHVYSSIIDQESGSTKINDVQTIMNIFDAVTE